MFICESWLFDWYFPQFCKSDMSKYGYFEVFHPFDFRDNESRPYVYSLNSQYDRAGTKHFKRPLLHKKLCQKPLTAVH